MVVSSAGLHIVILSSVVSSGFETTCLVFLGQLQERDHSRRSCSVANTELIGAAHQARSRPVPPCGKFAEREFQNSTAQCLHPLKMPTPVAVDEMDHEFFSAVIQKVI